MKNSINYRIVRRHLKALSKNSRIISENVSKQESTIAIDEIKNAIENYKTN